jgi:nucleotide-binding universal stress UspA family protein
MSLSNPHTPSPKGDRAETSIQVSLPEKIVVAVDGSDPSFKALSYAAKLAGLSKSKIVVLNVMSLPRWTAAKTADALKKDLANKAADVLGKAKSLGNSNGVEVETRSIETSESIVMAIIDFSNKEKADLIVMGTKGTSGYGKMMLGSVAAGVVSFASCPVLAVR